MTNRAAVLRSGPTVSGGVSRGNAPWRMFSEDFTIPGGGALFWWMAAAKLPS